MGLEHQDERETVGSEIPNADWMNNTQKYVATSSLEAPEWQNTTVLEGDVKEAVSQLKQEDGKNIMVNGSAGLVRSLIDWGLLDELRLYLHPVILGAGDRLFDDVKGQVGLELVEARTYDKGVVTLAYQPAER